MSQLDLGQTTYPLEEPARPPVGGTPFFPTHAGLAEAGFYVVGVLAAEISEIAERPREQPRVQGLFQMSACTPNRQEMLRVLQDDTAPSVTCHSWIPGDLP